MAVAFQKTIPILRIFNAEKAKEFYVGYLGFSVDWEHHFEDNTPAYLQVSRAGLTLHLSEHHGDCCRLETCPLLPEHRTTDLLTMLFG